MKQTLKVGMTVKIQFATDIKEATITALKAVEGVERVYYKIPGMDFEQVDIASWFAKRMKNAANGWSEQDLSSIDVEI